jgi:hypothetical protein
MGIITTTTSFHTSTDDCKHPTSSFNVITGFEIISEKAGIIELEAYGRHLHISIASLGASLVGQWVIFRWGILPWGMVVFEKLLSARSNVIAFHLEPVGPSSQGLVWRLAGGSCCHAPLITESELGSTLIGRLALAEQREGWRGIFRYFLGAICSRKRCEPLSHA